MAEQLFDGQPVIEFDNEGDRRAFLKYAGIFGVGMTLAACGNDNTKSSTGSTPAATTAPSAAPSAAALDSSTDSFGMGDLGILNYALTLEYLEADFYAKGVAANILGDAAPFIAPIAQHEAAHVSALTAAITKAGGTPAKKPGLKYPDGTFTDKAKFLATAQIFEETGVKAYHGQVTRIKDKGVLGAAASIAGVESRHAAIIADILGTKQVPSPVEANAPAGDIVKAVTPFLGA